MLIRHLYDRKADLECEGEANLPAAVLELQLEHQSDKSKAFSPHVSYENVKNEGRKWREDCRKFLQLWQTAGR